MARQGWAPDFWRVLVSEYGASPAAARHLSQKFGTASIRVMEIAKQEPRYAAAIVPGLAPIQAEVVYAVKQEMALTIEDVLARRVGLQLFSWTAAIQAAPVVGSLMAELLGWKADEKKSRGRGVRAEDQQDDECDRFEAVNTFGPVVRSQNNNE